MEVAIEPGTYVVAVSGGVDSVTLLDILARQATMYELGGLGQNSASSKLKSPNLELIVAHFDHGMRPDSADDRRFVQELAARYGLPFVFGEGHLGAGASEAAARSVRYEFLSKAQQAAGARAVVTAHHQDDVLETAVINLLRGTGRLGPPALRSTDLIKRPLLHLTKKQLIDYARKHKLIWRDDSTNLDSKYLRNRVRHNILTKLSPSSRRQLLAHVNRLSQLNREINRQLDSLIDKSPTDQPPRLSRHDFIMLPHSVAREVLAHWLRRNHFSDFDRKTLERLVAAAKTYRPGKYADINRGWTLAVTSCDLALVRRDR